MQSVDTFLFYVVNHGASNSFFDLVFPFISTTRNWYPVYALAILWLFIKGGKHGRLCALTLIIAVAILDPLSTHLLKENIGRLRPYDVLPDVIKRINSGAGSFPSNHAMNNAAAAFILSKYYPKNIWLWVSICGVIAFSRIYCGVHWPSDIISGILIGLLGGWVIHKLVTRIVESRTAYR